MISREQSPAIEPGAYFGREGLAADCHPLPNLLMLSADEIMSFYKRCQLSDFTRAFSAFRGGVLEVSDQIDLLGRYVASYPTPEFRRRMQAATIESLFREMHDHVMTHPVWVHPFFSRVAAGDITLRQLKVFSRHYFNQVKNTRQCVALALGRFHSFMDRPEGQLSTALSEMTQVILAGLLTDEYGTATPHARSEEVGPVAPAIDIGKLFSPVTHPALFRRFLDALGLSLTEHDVPMLHAVADNVLVQRILASDPAYEEVEALASVGLGMEWGVPAFFSMLIAGILKAARREKLALEPSAMEIWTAHVKQDVQHAIAVTIATAFFVRDESDLKRIQSATNILMAFRYEMMTAIYEEVFESRCGRIDEVRLEPRHFPNDGRIEPLLFSARFRVGAIAVRDYENYVSRRKPICCNRAR